FGHGDSGMERGSVRALAMTRPAYPRWRSGRLRRVKRAGRVAARRPGFARMGFGRMRPEAPVAQWIEHPPPKGRVARSIRAGGANPRAVAAMAHEPRIDPPAILLADRSFWPMARTSAIV